MSTFITENWLRENFGLGWGTEVHLPVDSRLTPAAHQLLEERKIVVKHVDSEGRVFAVQKGEETPLQVHPLTTSSHREQAVCLLCQQTVKQKPEALTHLDEHTMVAKNHPRLILRGKLDTLIARIVLTELEFDPENKYPWLHIYLADIRSYAGNLLKSEVNGNEMTSIHLGTVDEAVLHAVSHNPLKYLGHDHIVPEKSQGRNVALLNLLRAEVREVELEISRVFITAELTITRADLIRAANRLSSAIYVLMLLTLQAEQGKMINLEKVVLEQ
ncbi:MAG TPA: ethanolamine utilization cob(I)yrinic acid a,c-diamide adenosyltransferase EutT [bacterium]|nr:ethanolamine utilization cob(I)yrinic acid a,c-diamide adenosyltransferase EutT [bacterium]HNT65259.1 ethanolamine utilization cob(I)yrinic acid a,c-diamide adenosyltransferase EutT [bacterium]HOX86938.1 ethanolamine utilization cob(I)yrinic acid a,c-diamide adenosyltransferase EutT [bacterium]HPG46269.1 ethanolamine utilization cob(I)yrinic acid a,c-diamide adenosyltransferase EutT [bacterium]HPM98537.1 ethanolamine utilization cob(I)yrinic acid a,c-diamide adenosyltransferase EutT [bacteri